MPSWTNKRRRPSNCPKLEGKEIKDPASVNALYQMGDFKYQFAYADGTHSETLTCASTVERDWIIEELGKGLCITVAIPTAKKAG